MSKYAIKKNAERCRNMQTETCKQNNSKICNEKYASNMQIYAEICKTIYAVICTNMLAINMQIYALYMQLYALYLDLCDGNYMQKYAKISYA